jgi:hypothetical protein
LFKVCDHRIIGRISRPEDVRDVVSGEVYQIVKRLYKGDIQKGDYNFQKIWVKPNGDYETFYPFESLVRHQYG